MGAMRLFPLVLVVFFSACHAACPQPAPGPGADAAPPTPAWSTARAKNALSIGTTAYIAFGADSAIKPSDWSFCTPSGALTCSFALAPNEERDLPTGGRYANFTLSFGAPAGCGTTKAEMNLMNPAWNQDTVDVSLVDGFNAKLKISAPGTSPVGPPAGGDGGGDNTKAFGVFPLACDVCVARKNPPCGFTPCSGPSNGCGCKAGPDPYHPDVPCQASNPRPRAYTIALVQ